MASSVSVQLLLESVNKASAGINAVTGDLKSQRDSIKQLQAAEQARLATQKAALAQSKAFAAQGQFDADRTLKTQKAAALANQAAESAANKAAIAQKKYALAMSDSADAGKKFKGSLSGLDSGLGRIGSVASSVIGGTVVAAFAAATAGVLGFAKGISNAIDQEAKLTNLATVVARIRGSDRESATGVVQNLDRQLIQQSGGIVDVNTSRQLARTFFDDALTVFDNVDATRITADLSNRLASIIETEGADPGQFTNVLTDFLSGSTSIDALRTRDVLNDTGINKILIPLLEAGGKEIKNLDLKERFAILQKAIETALPDEALLAQAKTTKGLLQASFNKLFGANGLFDVQRDLFPEDTQVQSVFETFKVTLQQILGESGIFAQLGRILKSSGLDLDPMLALNQGLIRLNQWLMGINQALSNIQSIDVSSIGGALGQGFGQLVNSIFSSIDATALGAQVAQAVNGISDFIISAITTIDWGQVGVSLFNGIKSFFDNLSWQTYLVVGVGILAAVLLAAIGGAVAALAAGLVATVGAGTIAVLAAAALIITGLLGLIQTNWEGIKASISAGWQNLVTAFQTDWNTITTNISARFAELGAVIGQAWTVVTTIASEGIAQIGTWISQVWNSITSGLSSLGSAISGYISSAQSAGSSALGVVAGLISSLGSAIQGFIKNAQSTASSALGVIAGLLQSLGSTIQNYINSAISTAQSVFSAIASLVQSLGDSIKNGINSAISTAQSAFSGIADAVSNLASAISGAISGAISSATSALSNLVPGNQSSSGLTGKLYSSIAPAGAVTTNNIGGNITVNLTINQRSGQDSRQLADEVIRQLNSRLRQEQLGYSS